MSSLDPSDPDNKDLSPVQQVADAFEALADSLALIAERLSMGTSQIRKAVPEVDPTTEKALALTEELARKHRDMAAQMYSVQHSVLGHDDPWPDRIDERGDNS